jgi:hypothetical protein
MLNLFIFAACPVIFLVAIHANSHYLNVLKALLHTHQAL